MLASSSFSFLLLYGLPSGLRRASGPGCPSATDAGSPDVPEVEACGVAAMEELVATALALLLLMLRPPDEPGRPEVGKLAGGGLVIAGVPMIGLVARPELIVGLEEGKFSAW